MGDIQAVKTRFGIMGNNAQLNRALEIAISVAHTSMSVLVTGESGVGKEVFSKIIHNYSPRKHNKYIAVNCGALPSGTIESELFGHVKGSFTSADRDRKGYFTEADKGTLFLDEVGELPLEIQAKLLRVLENGEFIPVGSSKPLEADVRIVAATNVNLLEAIHKGRFREDLYYRLSQISVIVPPLRERKDDIYLLFRRFAIEQAERYKMPTITLTKEARTYLMSYPWQGNIRQLKNITDQISIIETNKEISLQTLQAYIPHINNLPMIVENESLGDGFNQRELILTVLKNKQKIEIIQKEQEELKTILKTILKNHENKPYYLAARSNIILNNTEEKEEEIGIEENIIDNDYDEIDEKPLTLVEMEKRAIISALKRLDGKRSRAAQELGISERTLYRKINEFNIDL